MSSTSGAAQGTVPPPIVHRRHRLADGRESLFFTDRGGRPVDSVYDARPLDPRSGNGEVRFDRLTGEWVAVAAHRSTRTYLPPADQCPLCPTTADRLSEIPAGDFDVVVFENRFPSLGPALGTLPEPGEAGGRELWGRPEPAFGRCEVVVFTPEHTGSFASLPYNRARTVVEAWAQRTEELSALEGIAHVFPFENRGQDIGVTLHHPHGQIYAYPYAAPHAVQLAERSRRHLAEHGRPLMGELLRAESEAGDRMVLAGEHFSAYVPYAARWPLEIHLVPHRQVPDLAALTGAERDELAAVYLDLLRRVDGLYKTPTPYISAWHQTPVTAADREAGWLHLQLTSPRRAEDKLKFLAGSEAAMGAFINDTTAEQTAARLREIRV
ncbi:galactose-1-phosphate uridylyltransferase [Arthrobacter sp. zg-Y20]|uniref:galactose-1-phosphate uridylyltransferase n=1 Tax=unclassified Arthrobacter TaxID=235627 RepID=UPI001D14DF95|nr:MULTISPECIES: galactose-1-phosphate uridylyltransferase [unclassified Arthrobacter]MCC3276434.1 galactose-1-phosphate uridylyltransferase [Arthrobacter sp. zg-Y20]MDK1316593.1 galactose-1-phosphate uridylyltransferase [Arthrobacter sp. zg.Y20]WIB06632.1 galactose-1-phosphate uridylyltransferase [Arthrobacter sp. zg-Y20]